MALELEVGAAVCLPLSLQEKQIGILWVNYAAPRHFSNWDIDGLQLYANQAAKAYGDARRLDELKKMQAAAKAMAEAPSLDQVLLAITQEAQSLFQAGSAAVWSYDDGRKKFIPNQLVATGMPEAILHTFRELEPTDHGITHTVLETEVLDVPDVQNSQAGFIRPEMRELLAQAGIQSFEGIALKAGTEPVGVLYVSYHQCRTFAEEDRRSLSSFASHAALSLKKARLLDQVKRTNEAARVVAHLTALGKDDLKDTLQRIAEEAQEVLGCDAVVLFAYDQLTEKLDHPPTMVGVKDAGKASQSEEMLLQQNSLVYQMLGKEDPYIVEDVAKDDLFKDRNFAIREQIQTCVAIPLRAQGQPTGVMFVNYRMPRRISSDEQATIGLFAYQAAVAIGNAQLHDRVTRRARALQAIHETGLVVTGSLELNEVLHRIAEQAWHLAGCSGDEIAFASIWLTDNTGPRLVAAYRPEMLNAAMEVLGNNGYLTPQTFGRMGVVGRAVQSKEPQLVPDVDKDKDFVRLFPGIRQQLAVPLKIGDGVIGVISVEHPRCKAFEKGDQDSLGTLAAQAAVAIQNARRFEDLKEIKGYVGSRTALDWMEMINKTWAHAIKREVATALAHVSLIRSAQGEGKITEELKELQDLERTIKVIREIPLIDPLSAEDKVSSVPINHFLREYLKSLRTNDRYPMVLLTEDLKKELDVTGVVRGSPAWIKQMFEILLDNAVEAMMTAGSSRKEITIGTRACGERLEISVRDTGPGIPQDFRDQVFQRPKEKPPGSKGAGIGLLVAATIVRTYGGEIGLGEPEAEGTTIRIFLPTEKSAEVQTRSVSA